MSHDRVRDSAELRRILALPSRDPDGSSLVEPMTAALRRPGGTQTLRPHQALALHDIGTKGGGFCPQGVGDGKTLISLLAPLMLDVRRTALLLPGGLIGKTIRDVASYSKHWPVSLDGMQIISYDILGRESGANALVDYSPDALILDEAHNAKNLDAACTRRIARYMAANPNTRMVVLSGTIMDRSLYDFAHLARWSLRENTPLPWDDHEFADWSRALDPDEYLKHTSRINPGALLKFAEPEDVRAHGELSAARLGFQRRFASTPGVVPTARDGEGCGASIYIRQVHLPLPKHVAEGLATMRAECIRPDDYELDSGSQIYQHAKELALGLHYAWDPPAPEEWRKARKAWFQFCRAILESSDHYDSPDQIASACLAGHLPRKALDRWRAIQPTFTPRTVPVWHDETALDYCGEWMRKSPGIVWTKHTLFARRLAKRTKAPYFAQNGLDKYTQCGIYIEDERGDRSIIASIDANKDGRNLQMFDRALITSTPDRPKDWQQLMGRHHRSGQKSDAVTFDVLCIVDEHNRAFCKCLSTAQALFETTGASQKLLTADVDWTDLTGRLP